MRVLMVCLLVLGVFTASKAQTDSLSEKSSYTCYHEDGTAFKCDMEEREGVRNNEGVNEGEMRKENPSNDHVFDPENKGTGEQENTEGTKEDITDQRGRREKDLYEEPEKESDEGILDTTGTLNQEGNGDGSSIQGNEGKREEENPQDTKVY